MGYLGPRKVFLCHMYIRTSRKEEESLPGPHVQKQINGCNNHKYEERMCLKFKSHSLNKTLVLQIFPDLEKSDEGY